MISLGGNSQLGIGIAISLHNQFSAQAKKVNQDLIDMRKNALSAMNAAARDYRNQSLGIAAAAGAISLGFYNTAKKGAALQHTINQTYIVGGKGLNRSRKDLEAFTLQMTKTFSRTPQEIAKVLFENVKAGVGPGLEEITKYQLAVASATDEALSGAEGVGEKLLGITYSMGLKATDQFEVAGKKMSQFARVANATTAASNATMASVYSIGESMEYFSNTAAIAGMSLEQALALVGKLAQSKITGSAAGTALNNMVQQLINSVGQFATPKKLKAWAALGIDPNMVKEMINSGNIYEAIEMIDSQSRGMNKVDRLGVFNTLFNMRGQRAMVNAFLGGEKSLSDIRKETESGVTGDVSMKQSRAMMNDLHSDIKFLANAGEAFKLSFTKAIEPGMRVAVKVATAILGVAARFVESPIGKVLATIVAAAAPMIGVLFAFRAAVLTATLTLNTMSRYNSVGGFRGLMGGMMGGWGTANRAGMNINKAGRAYVAAGQTVNYGGKVYTAGQILPKAATTAGMRAGYGIGGALGNFFGMGAMASAASGSAIMGSLSKMGSWIARLGGFALKWVPVVGWIWTAVELLRAIMGNTEDDKPETESQRYLRNINAYLTNQEMVKALPGYSSFQSKFIDAPQPAMNLAQNININLDGENLFSKKMEAKFDTNTLKDLDINFSH